MTVAGPWNSERVWSFPASTRSIGRARDAVVAELDRAGFGGSGPDHRAGHGWIDEVRLLVSELVTNAIVHAVGPCGLTLRIGADSIRVEVADTGGGGLQLRRPEPTESSGRGLLIVDTLARDWGVVHDGQTVGKTVWFELAAPTRP